MKKYKLIYTFLPVFLLACLLWTDIAQASSHREAPLIADDPLADNTDLYAFRSPDNPNTITIIANYIPGQLAQGGPNYYSFGENIRYEIHIDNNTETPGDDIIYRVTFKKENEDPTTFFNIRLGAQNLKTTYTLERSIDGGQSFEAIVTDGMVPPPNIGPRSIKGGAGLGVENYETLIQNAITTASTGETVYCGPADDPFYVDLGGIFDLGDAPRQDEDAMPCDGLSCFGVHSIALQIPISTLQKDGMGVDMAENILDGDYVIGVWASASRPQIRTLESGGTETYSGDWVQVSRLGMPLTNEAVIPIGDKDRWNALTPYNEDPAHFEYFYNPELALYMDDDQFGGAVPAFANLRVQRASLAGLVTPEGFDFGNGNDGLFVLKGNAALDGTALDDAIFGNLLLPEAGKPRSVDLWPAFHTGVPNFPPYQLATGKGGNPLAEGKPFINNFLPNGGDMLRLNMAVPPTPRDDENFSNLGLIQAAVLGLIDPAYNATTDIQFIPNMDGFPNGRRLEDDVTRIELQAVAGAVLAAVGLWYDDYTVGDANPVTDQLLGVLGYSTGVEENDAEFKPSFPYLAAPWDGSGPCGGKEVVPVEVVAGPDCSTLEVSHIVDCDNGTGTFIVWLGVQGGTAPYQVEGSFNGIIEEDNGQTLLVGPFTDGSGYNFIVTDAQDCMVTIDEQPVPCTKLPIELLSFEGEVKETGNLITWTTASEINNQYFSLQRATDGQNFVEITRIKGQGNTNKVHSYEYMDAFTQSGLVYYRLKQVDFDGQSEEGPTISLLRENDTRLQFTGLYPVPVKEVLSGSFISNSNTPTLIELRDVSGKLFYSETMATDITANNQFSIAIPELSSGMYFISLSNDGQIIVTKFLKQ